jgi:DNA-binding transcriptional ArsR family regulator
MSKENAPVSRAPADIAPGAALFADPSRARIVCALVDRRALPASVLAAEAGVSASTASEHLGRLVDGGVLRVERSGRHRYYRLAGPDIAAVVESLAAIAPQPPVRSLRESTRAAALRRARTCYDHLAGRLGVAVTAALVEAGALDRTDGGTGVQRGAGDRLSAPVPAHPYRLGPGAQDVFGTLGVDLPAVLAGRREPLRFCVDWSEQQHHLAGGLGAALLTALIDTDWVRPTARRAVQLTDAGRDGLRERLGLDAQLSAVPAVAV